MDSRTAFYMSLSILAPLGVGLYKYKEIVRIYRPLILLLLAGLVNELICYPLNNNAVPNNIYLIVEYLLFCWQFKNWGNILKNKNLFYALTISLLIVWVIENIFMGRINMYSPIFCVSYCVALVLLAVNQLNWIIINDRNEILKNPIFLICIDVIFFSPIELWLKYSMISLQTIPSDNIYSASKPTSMYFSIFY